MKVPAAMVIEMGRDSLQALPVDARQAELKELRAAIGSPTADYEEGYLLGLETARAMIAFSPIGPTVRQAVNDSADSIGAAAHQKLAGTLL